MPSIAIASPAAMQVPAIQTGTPIVSPASPRATRSLRLIDLLPKSFNNEAAKDLWANTCGPNFSSTEPQPPTYEGPFPIFNTTLNLSFGQDLAYQERKGASFHLHSALLRLRRWLD